MLYHGLPELAIICIALCIDILNTFFLAHQIEISYVLPPYMAYHGDKFLHIGAVTIVNNRDHAQYYAIEEEIESRGRTFLINSAVGC